MSETHSVSDMNVQGTLYMLYVCSSQYYANPTIQHILRTDILYTDYPCGIRGRNRETQISYHARAHLPEAGLGRLCCSFVCAVAEISADTARACGSCPIDWKIERSQPPTEPGRGWRSGPPRHAPLPHLSLCVCMYDPWLNSLFIIT